MTTPDFDLGLLIDVDQLIPYLGHPQLRIIDLCRSSVYEQLHIPHAVHIRPHQLVQSDELATGRLPDESKLIELIQALNISPEHHVVVYDDEGGAWAGRLIWNLHCLGFAQTSLLNGGIHAWLAAAYPVSSEKPQLEVLSHLVQPNLSQVQAYRIGYDDLKVEVTNKTIQLWDCRSHDEYTGQRLAARRGGHIAGAHHYEWSTALNRENHLKLHTLERIKTNLEHAGLDLSHPVVVYCQSHHRSGLAYIIGCLLGWQIVAYDGAWSEWGNRPDSPIVSGEFPFES